jgi:hypothetical protein
MKKIYEKTCMRTAKAPLPCADFGLCHAAVLCRALASFFTVRSGASLPCAAHCRVFFDAFAVRHFVAVRGTSVAQQRNLCRVTTHGRV